jgi:hypothetical protein
MKPLEFSIGQEETEQIAAEFSIASPWSRAASGQMHPMPHRGNAVVVGQK